MSNSKYTHRYIARFIIETVTPLAVGSGESDFLTDSIIAKDANGLPYIPGTAIAGIIRHAISAGIDSESVDGLFGYKAISKKDGKDESGKGSEIIFSEARMIGEDGKVVDGLKGPLESTFYKTFNRLPIRQHVRINEKGVAERGGKFDEQVLFRGTRFCFEIEMMSDGKNYDYDLFKSVLSQICSPLIRIGSGTRNGFGEMKVIECKIRCLDLKKEDGSDLVFYLKKSSSLSTDWKGETFLCDSSQNNDWETYKVELKPEDFFSFSSGFGDDEADNTPAKESYICWADDKPVFADEKNWLYAPATSIKGALSHRVAFHWNKLNKLFADDGSGKVGSDNPAVSALFGYTKDKEIKRGNVLISADLHKTGNDEKFEKIVNHVAIDRFTGGAFNLGGALFTEKTVIGKDNFTLVITLHVNKAAWDERDETIKKAFEEALSDLKNGMLPLGGGVNRGNGLFKVKQ